MKDSIHCMLNTLIRVYINVRFRSVDGLTDDWKIRFEVYFPHGLSLLKRHLIRSL